MEVLTSPSLFHCASHCVRSQADEPGLLRAWEGKHNLGALVAAEIVSLYAQNISSGMKNFKDSFIAINRVCKVGCDRGVAIVVSSWPFEDTVGKDRIGLLIKKSFGTSKATDDADEDADETEKSSRRKDSVTEACEWINFIPPRIALEHPNSSVRLIAIQRLLDEVLSGDSNDERNVEMSEDGLADALLRRAAADRQKGRGKGEAENTDKVSRQ